MHGEYKVPGGKLVVVDLEERDGRIADFHLAGDFFLEPDTALDDIDAAVNGLPVEADVAAIAAAVRAALPDGAQLLGLHARGRRHGGAPRARHGARAGATSTGRSCTRRPVSPRMNLALDEVLTARVGDGRRRPTLRLWEWDESAVVIGSFQSLRNEVDPEGAARHGFDVVRRISGGGAMLMAADQIITYSLYVPASLVAGMTFADSYAFLDDWVLQALRSLGIEATYQPLNDIASPHGQDRRRRAEAPRERRSAAPRDPELRHGRPDDDRGAAHRPREAQRQGHDLGRQARRPAAQPDRPAARGRSSSASSRRSEPLRRRARAVSPKRSTPRPRRSSSRSSRPTRGCAGCRDAPPHAGATAVPRPDRSTIHQGDNLEVHPRASPTARSRSSTSTRRSTPAACRASRSRPPRAPGSQIGTARETHRAAPDCSDGRRGSAAPVQTRDPPRRHGPSCGAGSTAATTSGCAATLRAYDDRFDDYWGFLEPRLEEAWRLLADDGTLYLHLDYREAHYAKVHARRAVRARPLPQRADLGVRLRRQDAPRWPTKHDTILVYVKDPRAYCFDSDAVDREPYMAPGLVTPEKAARGKLPTDVWWHTIVPTTGREKTGYPTQKPEGILRRIVQASSRPGDRVLDFFAGSGTTGAVAVGARPRRGAVDENPEAIAVMARRMPGATRLAGARPGVRLGLPAAPRLPGAAMCSAQPLPRRASVSSRLISAARANSSFANSICSSLRVSRYSAHRAPTRP